MPDRYVSSKRDLSQKEESPLDRIWAVALTKKGLKHRAKTNKFVGGQRGSSLQWTSKLSANVGKHGHENDVSQVARVQFREWWGRGEHILTDGVAAGRNTVNELQLSHSRTRLGAMSSITWYKTKPMAWTPETQGRGATTGIILSR